MTRVQLRQVIDPIRLDTNNGKRYDTTDTDEQQKEIPSFCCLIQNVCSLINMTLSCISLYSCRYNLICTKRSIRSRCFFIILKRSCTGNLKKLLHALIHSNLNLPGRNVAAKATTSVRRFVKSVVYFNKLSVLKSVPYRI